MKTFPFRYYSPYIIEELQGSLSMVITSTCPPQLLFFDHFWPFFANFMTIFHKIEVVNRSESYLTGSKVMTQNAKMQMLFFWKKMEMEMFSFCAIIFFQLRFRPVQHLFVKDIHVVGKKVAKDTLTIYLGFLKKEPVTYY